MRLGRGPALSDVQLAGVAGPIALRDTVSGYHSAMRKIRRISLLLAALVLLAFHHAAPMMPTGGHGMPSGGGMPQTMLLAGACLAVSSERVRKAMRRILAVRFAPPAWPSVRAIAPSARALQARAIDHPPPQPDLFSLCVIRR